MSQARPQAWWRQAHSDLDLVQIASGRGVHAQSCFLAVTSGDPLDDTPPMDRFDPADSAQAIATATAVLAWVERLDRPG